MAFGKVQVNALTINSFQQRWYKHKTGGNVYSYAFVDKIKAKNEASVKVKRDELVYKADGTVCTETGEHSCRAFIYEKPEKPKTSKDYDIQKMLDMYKQVSETKKEGESFDALAKCIRIAMRIQRGDNVPAKDDNYLFENYPRLHLQAWSLRKEKDDPKNCKSELKDEKQEYNVSFNTASPGFNMSVEGLSVSVSCGDDFDVSA